MFVGRSSRSSIGTLVERRSRYVRLLYLPGGHRAEPFAWALGALFEQIPEHARWTMIWDQGAEMARHDLVGHLFAEGVYFAHAASPWLRGTNERRTDCFGSISRRAPICPSTNPRCCAKSRSA
ncbi:IS30 family transposase [Rhodococcus opacus]|nr:IS30 family transposase [Rhodococcus opacus]